MLTSDDTRRSEFHLSGPTGAAVGLGLALVMIAPIALFLSELAAFQFLAVQLGFIGAVYFGFAVAEGKVLPLLLEFNVAGAFMIAGAAALWADSPVVLLAGYAAHGVWDLVHHPRAVTTPVRSWYPPFCVVFDMVLAAFIAIRF
jgi:hypothetical protein